MKGRLVQQKTSAFVLHALDYGESDRIITFYTGEFGKLKGIAKGARRSRKRFANALELFSCSTIIFSQRETHGLAFIAGCDTTCHYPAIRADLEKTLVASYLIDLVNHFTVEGKKSQEIFQLLSEFLELMESGALSEGLIRLFELRILKHSGYEPVLERCVHCHRFVTKDHSYFFFPADGGIRCSGCLASPPNSLPLSLATLKLLLLGKELPSAKTQRLVFSNQALRESKDFLACFIRHLLGKELKSLQILNKIKAMNT